MKRLSMLIIAVGVVFFVMKFTEKSPPPSKPVPVKTATSSAQPNQPPPAAAQTQAKASQTVWPHLAEDPEEKKLAQNLTAKNYVLIFDGSGSMGEVKCSDNRKKIDVAREAVVEWSKSVPENANIGLVAFHNEGWITGKLSETRRQDFINSVNAVIYGGKTPLTKAFQLAYSDLTRQAQKQLGYGEYTIVVVTDGIANNVGNLSQIVEAILQATPINIYTIGFCIGENHTLNQPGKTLYKAADNPQELRQGLKAVLAEADTFDDAKFGE
jgi:Ca-activated chloride channel family protein